MLQVCKIFAFLAVKQDISWDEGSQGLYNSNRWVFWGLGSRFLPAEGDKLLLPKLCSLTVLCVSKQAVCEQCKAVIEPEKQIAVWKSAVT